MTGDNQEKPHILLKKLGLSESEIQLYLTLVSYGALTAGDLIKITAAKRPTVYYALRQLQEHGLVHRTGTPGTERFQAESPEKLLNLVTFRERELQELGKELQIIIPLLATAHRPYEGIPGVSFYEGETAMKQAITETLYCRSRHIDSLAPSDNFFWQVGQNFSANYIQERIARKITTRNLWEMPLEPKIMLHSYAGLSEVRILPKAMHGRFRTTMFLYDDKVMYVSSLKSGYVLVVRSKEHYETMKALYDGLWEHSTSAA